MILVQAFLTVTTLRTAPDGYQLEWQSVSNHRVPGEEGQAHEILSFRNYRCSSSVVDLYTRLCADFSGNGLASRSDADAGAGSGS